LRIAVLGLGNLLMGDEGVGIHVLHKLKERGPPEGVELVDGGTAGIDLLPVLKQADRVIIIDAVRAGGRPGSIYRFKPEDLKGETPMALSLHQFSLQDVLHSAHLLGIEPEITIIGVEPKRIAPGLELSEELQEVLPQLVEVVWAELSG
jgi:hydrogenase maturation protease